MKFFNLGLPVFLFAEFCLCLPILYCSMFEWEKNLQRNVLIWLTLVAFSIALFIWVLYVPSF